MLGGIGSDWSDSKTRTRVGGSRCWEPAVKEGAGARGNDRWMRYTLLAKAGSCGSGPQLQSHSSQMNTTHPRNNQKCGAWLYAAP